MIFRSLCLTAAFLLLTACTTSTTVVKADLTKGQGVYVVGFTADPEIRKTLEDQLVDDLSDRDIIARASYTDIPTIRRSSRDEVIRQANANNLLSVLILNRVAADASDSVVQDPKRISPVHPDLQAFYAYADQQQPEAIAGAQRVLVEVNLFMIDGDQAGLFWSGTTWSERGDGKGGAVKDVSSLVAQQLAAARSRMIGL